jgi:hypothetical protein
MGKIASKLHRIFTGFYLVMTGHDSPKAIERRLICKKCKLRNGLICGECGCVISAKVQLEEEECPVGKW